MGALLAWIVNDRPLMLEKAYRFIRAAGIASIIILLLFIVTGIPFVLKRTLVSVLAAWLIAAVMYRDKLGTANRMLLLNSKALSFVGKISFGLYLFHPLVPVYTKEPLDWLINSRLPASLDSYQVFFLVAENLVILILLAWLLWRFIEKPFVSLKRYLPVKKEELTLQPAPIQAS